MKKLLLTFFIVFLFHQHHLRLKTFNMLVLLVEMLRIFR